MAQPNWKISSTNESADSPPITYLSFRAAKKFFAVDNSGSTLGSRIRAEGRAVLGMHSNVADTVIRWNDQCSRSPELVDNISPGYFKDVSGGTSPEEILKDYLAVQEINLSDIWCLLTDGISYDFSVTEFTQLANRRNLTHVPMILMIVSYKAPTPEQTNISVGIPLYANTQEAAILFKDAKNGEIFVIAAKGSLSPLTDTSTEPTSKNLNSWKSLPVFSNEGSFMQRLEDLAIKVISSKDRRVTKAISLGPGWETATHSLVDVDSLLKQTHLEPGDLHNILEEEAINTLALICKTRDRLRDLRLLLIRHKQQEILIRWEDRHSATKILEDMQAIDLTQEMNSRLRERLRDAHAANRAFYSRLIGSPNEDVRNAREVHRLINRGLAILAHVENSEYTVDLINRKSNQAQRAETVASGVAEVDLSSLDLSDSVDAFRDNCSICCGEGQIMSVALKSSGAVEKNMTDFALDFPLAAGQGAQNDGMVSAQFVCFQCALICPKSIFKENLSAILPTVGYVGANTTYINHQLTSAITGDFLAEVPRIGQIFMTILDRTLETKDWCSDQSQAEAAQVDQGKRARRLALKWVLRTFLSNCKIRENFDETGKWVAYPQALTWAIKNFQQTGLASWAIQYPLAGFNQLMRWYGILKLKLPQNALKVLLRMKLVHYTVNEFMVPVLRNEKDHQEGKHLFLGLIYKEFNAPGVPRDEGKASILDAKNFWSRFEAAFGHLSDFRQFLSLFDDSSRTKMCRRIQLITFWAFFTQEEHPTPESFFQTLNLREPLWAPAVLNMTSKLSEYSVMAILLSIFCPTKTLANIVHEKKPCPLFMSPFGPSVLWCGHTGCRIRFYGRADLSPLNPDAFRKKRALHLKKVYGVTPEFDNSETGLPERIAVPMPPSSYSCNLHVSIARVWSKIDRSLETKESQPSTPKSWGDPAQKFKLSKEAVMEGDKDAVSAFIKEVIFEICAVNGRGNIYEGNLEADIRQVLPSFYYTLRVASRKLGLDDCSGLAYKHDWKKGYRFEARIKYELSL